MKKMKKQERKRYPFINVPQKILKIQSIMRVK